MQSTRSRALFEKARKYIPYGVNSNFRYRGDDHTPIMCRGEGAHVWDADDNRFIDYRLGFGPIILGHAYPAVTRRVAEAIQSGVLFAATTPVEIEVAERFTRMTGMDKVRLSNTGTEANMHALRIARAYTGREKFIKFEGNYHGNFDYVMFSGDTPPTDYRSYSTFDAELFGKLGTALIANGVLVNDDPREPWFLSYSHGEAVIADTLARVETALTDAFGKRTPLRHAA